MKRYRGREFTWLKFVFCLALFSCVFSFSHVHIARADAPSSTTLPFVDPSMQSDLTTYDASGGTCDSTGQQYYVGNWISQGGSPTNITTNIQPTGGNGNGTYDYNLQLNIMDFVCYQLSTDKNSHYNPGNSPPASGGPDSVDLTKSYDNVIDERATSGVSFDTPTPTGQVMEIDRQSGTRFWFNNYPFNIKYTNNNFTSAATITITLTVRPVNNFNGTLLCVNHSNGKVVTANNTQGTNCPTNPVSITFTLAPPLTVTISGRVTQTSGSQTVGIKYGTHDGVPINQAAYIQVCNGGGNCSTNGYGNYSIAMNGDYSFSLPEYATFYIYSQAVDGSEGPPTLTTYANSGGAYVNQPADPSAGSYNFYYFMPKGSLESADCSQVKGWADSPDPDNQYQPSPTQNPVTVQIVVSGNFNGTYGTTANQYRNPSQNNEFILTSPYGNHSGPITVTAYILANNTSYYLGSIGGLSCDNSPPGGGPPGNGGGAPPAPSISVSCSARTVTLTGNDADNGSPSFNYITYYIDGAQYSSNHSPTVVDMSGYDQLVGHSISETVADVGVAGGPGNLPSASASPATYPPCYQATCGTASFSKSEVEVSSPFSATIILTLTPINGAGPPPPSAMGGTLTDFYQGQSYSVNNTYKITSTFTSPATAGDYPVTWNYTDPGGVGLPISGCQDTPGNGGNPGPIVVDEPYLRVYGGDVTSGQGFSTAGTCSTTAANIIAWNEAGAGGYAGAGVQFAAEAMGTITDLATADGTAPPGGVNGGGLAFANTTNAGDTFGGSAQAAIPCMPDYYGDSAAVPAGTTVYNCPGDANITNDQISCAGLNCNGPSCNGSLSNVSASTVVRATGNVTISDNNGSTQGPSYNQSGPWVSTVTEEVPHTGYHTEPNPGVTTSPTVNGSNFATAGIATLTTLGATRIVSLTQSSNEGAGSAFYRTPVSTVTQVGDDGTKVGLDASFREWIGGGTGADGLTLLLNGCASPGSSPLGPLGGGLGADFSCGNTVAIALDTYQNWNGWGGTDPGSNYIGIADGVTDQQGSVGTTAVTNNCDPSTSPPCHLNWLAVNTTVPPLTNPNFYASYLINVTYDSTTRVVTASLNGGYTISATLPFALPATALLGFSGAQGGENDGHFVGDVSITQQNGTQRIPYTYDTPVQVPNTDSLAIPSLYVITKGGNINIDPSIHSMDGVYIAEPSGTSGGTIYTCDAAIDQNYYANCNSQLVVNGAFAANKVAFGRTLSTAKQGAAGGTATDGATQAGWANAGEVFNYTPEVWLNNPFSQTSSSYDAIASLPPVL